MYFDSSENGVALVPVSNEGVAVRADELRRLSGVGRTLSGGDATIAKLPVEVLRSIFLDCLDITSSKPLCRRSPVVLSRVCQRWRHVALSTFELWRYLSFDWQLESGDGVAARADGVHGRRNPRPRSMRNSPLSGIFSWLKCAQHHPLVLELKVPPATSSSALHELFLLHGSHTRGLSLSAPFSALQGLATMVQTAPSRHRTLFPNMEVLHFSMPYEDLDRASTRRFTATRNIDLSGCVKLRTLQFDSVDKSFGFITDNLVSGIPYAQLTDLYVTERSLHPLVARKILMGCSRLTRCYMKIGQWAPDDDVPISENFITLAHLDTLVLRFANRQSSDGIISPFFEALTLPALKKLTIEAPNALDPDLIVVLIAMQDRSNAPIEKLAFMDIFLTRHQLPGLLSALPMLKYLHVQAPPGGRCGGYTDVVVAISLPDTAHLVPLLEEICIVDNLFLRYSDGNGRLARDLVGRPLDISKPLKDYHVLDAIEKRCSYYSAVVVQQPGDPGPGKRTLEVVNVQWRNVPEEWRDAERPALARKEEIEDAFDVAIYLPLHA